MQVDVCTLWVYCRCSGMIAYYYAGACSIVSMYFNVNASYVSFHAYYRFLVFMRTLVEIASLTHERAKVTFEDERGDAHNNS